MEACMKRNIMRLLAAGIILINCSGCKNWEYDVEKNGIHFERISQAESGTIIGFMRENHEIGGFPCEKGWIHFKEDFNLQSFQLSEEFTYKNTRLPAHTWIHMPYKGETGYIISLPFDYKIERYLCSGNGGYKGTQTGFYDSGRLRSFYPPKDTAINGVQCKATIFDNINLHENGRLKSCILAQDYPANGVTIKKGTRIELGESGKIK
jgi:hypothetical protein